MHKSKKGIGIPWIKFLLPPNTVASLKYYLSLGWKMNWNEGPGSIPLGDRHIGGHVRWFLITVLVLPPLSFLMLAVSGRHCKKCTNTRKRQTGAKSISSSYTIGLLNSVGNMIIINVLLLIFIH